METKIIRSRKELSEAIREVKKAGKRVGLVPTMGYLHEGHMSLIRAARERCDFVVVSDFVNPTQFCPGEDYATYPRDEAADFEKARVCGADILFIPTPETLYPNGEGTWVEVNGLDGILCGASRPGHFRGVATVVTKLLFLTQADEAFFGEKDYQQLTLIRRMADDLCCPTQIVGMPLVREADGLALSSRNVRLSPQARKSALSLSLGLRHAREAFGMGCRDVHALSLIVRETIEAYPETDIEYIAVAHPDTLAIYDDVSGNEAVMLLAVRVGGVRLIDNMRLDARA